MLTLTSRWSHAPGNRVVPSPWQATPALAHYWADRRRKHRPPQLAESWQRDLRVQRGLCALCVEPLLYADHAPDSPSQWETWYRGIRKAIARKAIAEHHSGRTTHRLVHVHCARRQPSDQAHDPDHQTHDARPPTRAA